MGYIVCSVLFTLLTIFILRKNRIEGAYSKGILVLLILFLLSNIALAQNYTSSLIPGYADGILISNKVAYWIIGEDGWSQQVFKKAFDTSVWISFTLVITYVCVLVIETIIARKMK